MAIRSLEAQAEIRASAFNWLLSRNVGGEYEFSRHSLVHDFTVDGERFPLIDQMGRGIRNPGTFTSTLSLWTSHSKRRAADYADDFDPQTGILRYSYQRGDVGTNRKLAEAHTRRDPLIYFQATRPNFAVAYFPAYIESNSPEDRSIHLSLTASIVGERLLPSNYLDERSYVERSLWQRLHQPMFRARVMFAYERRCAVCRLRHPELLDAAHIMGDRHELGTPEVRNGLSLCKIHHAAYDRNLIGISPDYRVLVARDLLDEVDGPMLRHGLQDMHGSRLSIPADAADHPDRERLKVRFAEFRGQ